MIDVKKLRAFVEANPKLVTVRPSVRHPDLFVVKYKNCVFYESLWTPELMETRGLVVDKDWNIIVYPFTKIFNRFENGTDIDLEEQVIAVEKINGFMGCLTYYNGQNIVSTTGSLDSEYVGLAEQYLQDLVVPAGYTYMFEICDPEDKHIIEQVPGAYLIGVRNNATYQMHYEWMLDVIARNRLKVKRPTWKKAKFADVVDEVSNSQKEGVVVYGKNVTLKIKSPYYLINKFLGRKRADKLLDLLDDSNKIKQTIDEEFYPLIDHLVANKQLFVSLDEQARIGYIMGFLNK
jgi:hypothetical protein